MKKRYHIEIKYLHIISSNNCSVILPFINTKQSVNFFTTNDLFNNIIWKKKSKKKVK